MERIRTMIGYEGMIVVEPQGRSRGFYGELNRSRRRKTWDSLRKLARDSNLPWCVIGDLNNILAQEEKKGGDVYPRRLVDGFRKAIMDAGLRDLDIVGQQFTWERGRNTNHWVGIRLDRGLVDTAWLQIFPLAKLYNLEGSPSDHSPIVLEPKMNETRKSKKRFRFGNAWLTETLCFQLVKENWEANSERNILQKIQACGEELDVWGKEVTGCFSRRIRECKVKLNTRRRMNQIFKLKNDQGVWQTWEDGLSDLVKYYFQELFSTNQTQGEEVIDCVTRSISTEKNRELIALVTTEEVKSAVFQMHPDKTPGPDGMTPTFFQKHWSIVGGDVIKLVREFFLTGTLVEDINKTNIVLIPKKNNPMVVGDLRPICNILMKVITKVIANRLKELLSTVVSDTQSAFIPGRLIPDNVMISYEIMHYLKRKNRGKEGYMALKLDMSKAYDCIE
ncbi:uncharacterized protein LOC141689493 [Apium graveolens]|uniref:uncharacterized protein LOC141689493 n=1 Tax=Apium graveolens TaxID=4045 RepID=UPI003D79D0BF